MVSEALYRIEVNLAESNDLNDGDLSPAQQNAYDELSARINAAINTLQLMDCSYDGTTAQIDVAWFSGASLTLAKKTKLSDATWSEQAAAVVSNTGGTTSSITLDDSGTQAFY